MQFLFNPHPMKGNISMKNETLNVTGMTCDGCTGKVAHALKALTGVHDIVVSLSAREAAVRYDEHLTSPDKLK